MQGLIIYAKADKDKNIFFINKIINGFLKYHIDIIYYDEEDINNIDVTLFDFAIYRGRDYKISQYLSINNIKVFNNYEINKTANDKYLSYALFKELNLPCFDTYLDINELNDYPIVMKTTSGHGGSEVFLINNKSESYKIKNKINKKFIYQKYYSLDGDIRIYALGKEIICAIKRSNKNDFRFNYSLNGDIELYEIDEQIKNIVSILYKRLNYDFIGIDIFIKDNKYYLNEIEDPVGSRMVYKLLDIDIIDKFIDYIYQYLNEYISSNKKSQ